MSGERQGRDLRDDRENYLGKVGTAAEHRTVGDHRAWCHDCGEWCYPSSPCGEPRCCAALPAPSSTPPARDSGRYGEHPDTIGDGLHLIAEWMDEADALMDRVFAAHGQERTNSGDQVQQDVRRLADWFRAHPDAAAAAWAHVKAEPVTSARRSPRTSA